MILTADSVELANHFGLDAPPNVTPRYNIAPSQLVAVVAPKCEKRGLAFVKWGLVPYWSNDGRGGHINARAETVAGLPTFSDSFRERRCIIPASGFYEWRTEGGRKRPHRFRLASGGVMGFAGLWSRWEVEGEPKLLTCCVITTVANDVVRPFHDRMPAVLKPEDYEQWLDADAPLKEVHALLKPYPAELMEVSAASPLVNSPRNEGPQLLDPAA
jgi:putative SOS response-associated peptidase YedK